MAELAEWDRWQPVPKIALLEVEHMVNCINFNNCFLCFDKNWQKPKDPLPKIISTALLDCSPLKRMLLLSSAEG